MSTFPPQRAFMKTLEYTFLERTLRDGTDPTAAVAEEARRGGAGGSAARGLPRWAAPAAVALGIAALAAAERSRL